MSLIVLGLSHQTAPVDLLERVALAPEQVDRLAGLLGTSDNLSEYLVLSTCNRIEVYAEVETFHGAVTTMSQSLATATGVGVNELREHLYVHFEDRAVAHVFTTAAGLDSMAVGDVQVLGQLREAHRIAHENDRLGPALETLVQRALRVGKRAHAETDIDTVSRSLVERSLQQAERVLGALPAQRALVVGAGAMSGLTAHTLTRAGVTELVILNRTAERADRLAAATGGIARPWSDLEDALTEADLVISCTGSVGHVLSSDLVRRVHHDGRPQVLVDLALPRDIDPVVTDLRGLTLLSLDSLGAEAGVGDSAEQAQVHAVEALVTAEVAEFLVERRAAAVGPTVAALRSRAVQVVSSEIERLQQRLELTDQDEAQVRQTVHRVVEKILHAPTVRMKQLAGDDQGHDYAELMRTLFDLDPRDSRVSRIPTGGDFA